MSIAASWNSQIQRQKCGGHSLISFLSNSWMSKEISTRFSMKLPDKIMRTCEDGCIVWMFEEFLM